MKRRNFLKALGCAPLLYAAPAIAIPEKKSIVPKTVSELNEMILAYLPNDPVINYGDAIAISSIGIIPPSAYKDMSKSKHHSYRHEYVVAQYRKNIDYEEDDEVESLVMLAWLDFQKKAKGAKKMYVRRNMELSHVTDRGNMTDWRIAGRYSFYR